MPKVFPIREVKGGGGGDNEEVADLILCQEWERPLLSISLPHFRRSSDPDRVNRARLTLWAATNDLHMSSRALRMASNNLEHRCIQHPASTFMMIELPPTIRSIFKNTLEFYVNGTRIELANPNPQWTLLDFIRSQHGLKGTKLGCGEGGCGACTVVLQTLEEGAIKHLAINACLFPLIGGRPILHLM